MSELVICNKKYKCEYIGRCEHRVPHQPYEYGCDQKVSGTTAYCHSGKMKSICVPITDERYLSNEIKHCSCGEPKCNGMWVELLSHSIEEVPNEM